MEMDNRIYWSEITVDAMRFALAATEVGLYQILLPSGKAKSRENWLQTLGLTRQVVYSEAYLQPYNEQLYEYFRGERQEFALPLDMRGTTFQLAVWEALRSIPYGQVCSYSDIAKSIGRPLAVRAVGMANGANPLPIVVPCHRVIGKNGALTGYGGGLPLKERLLAVEGFRIS